MVLHPYKLVKDTRNGVETVDVQSVLDGGSGLDELMEGFLRSRGRAEGDKGRAEGDKGMAEAADDEGG